MPRKFARRLRDKLEHLAKDPYAANRNITKLQDRPGYRLRVGDWRAIYEIQGQELVILVLKTAPRGKVYR